MSVIATRLALLSVLGLPLMPLASLAQSAAQSALPGADPVVSPVEAVQPDATEKAPPPVTALPLAPQVKGERPRLNPRLVTPAATELLPPLEKLPAPDSLALPTKPAQVQIRELRPLSLVQVENLAEVNNPNLKAIASQVDQAQSNLRAQIAQWYPTIDFQGSSFPTYTDSETRNRVRTAPPPTETDPQPAKRTINQTLTGDRWAAALTLSAQWSLINPQRTPTIAAARDQFERARYQYVIALRDLRLQAAQSYFDLQQADDQVRIGQESVRASLVSLRDSKARFQAGVATKLEVLEAETQLARDQQLLTSAFASQSIARRALATLLDLPQTITPTAQDPSRVLGVWQPSLQESIVAAYAFREELDQVLLDISIANSQANASLAQVQPFLNIVAGLDAGWYDGNQPIVGSQDVESGASYDASIGLNFSWNLFDGGAAAAQARQNRQLAQENRFRFAQRRDGIRFEVEESFYELEKNNRNITTTAREVISARESLRLARLRFQAGVTTQREVVDNQRDLTNAEVRYSSAIADYNKRLAELRRRTGLDQIVSCPAQSMSGVKPAGVSDVPVEPSRLLPACQAATPGPV
ncbi:MAG: TolC family protein [Cyanobium sp.]|nr:TolC family protein [Cyanobium sp.]